MLDMLRIKDRIRGHFYGIEKPDLYHAVARHFSSRCHNGIRDVKISALEFIDKAPRSPAASIICNRVERKWMNILRTCAPQGLSIDD